MYKNTLHFYLASTPLLPSWPAFSSSGNFLYLLCHSSKSPISSSHLLSIPSTPVPKLCPNWDLSSPPAWMYIRIYLCSIAESTSCPVHLSISCRALVNWMICWLPGSESAFLEALQLLFLPAPILAIIGCTRSVMTEAEIYTSLLQLCFHVCSFLKPVLGHLRKNLLHLDPEISEADICRGSSSIFLFKATAILCISSAPHHKSRRPEKTV